MTVDKKDDVEAEIAVWTPTSARRSNGWTMIASTAKPTLA